ncbi:hypothetical protein Cenrod_0454 [Candidatus Symbiobacter mobilis CR]|uniref:Thymidine phosphorylase n=2 Tax=Candidatus Symbiobacter TaxID=1436289 RepID=U5N4Y7_9BURK|nr:hypothetical protein Cenrod_0454 [Candidatus Symbiobacter mobilis CR]
MDGKPLLMQVLSAVRRALETAARQQSSPMERDRLRLSIKLLEDKARALAERFAVVLRGYLEDRRIPDSPLESMACAGLHHKQLQHMNTRQMQEQMQLVRALQEIRQITQQSLTELDGFVCAMLGLTAVRPTQNPLRPVVYLTALQESFVHTAIPAQVRMDWLNHTMPAVLGKALQDLYAGLCGYLHSQGVAALAAALQKSATSESASPPSFAPTGHLTIDNLHSLLTGEDTHPASCDEGIRYAGTVPAAFDDATPTQPDAVLATDQRALLEATLQESTPQAVRQMLLTGCSDTQQLLGIEVVSLMVDNIVHDKRLLEPIRRVIENLEPALLRMVIVDPRFFRDREHPARALLNEITERGLAFASVNAPHFGAFVMSLYRCVVPLCKQFIEDDAPFVDALEKLRTMWAATCDRKSGAAPETAVKALQEAEARNLIAAKMVAALELLPELRRVPAPIAEFLCGPWTQVMACAELHHGKNDEDPGHYKELVNALLWSAQPDLTRQNVSKLTKLVPRLLSTLREGLKLIDYPSTATSAFFDVLMKLHQQAFQTTSPPVVVPPSRHGLAPSLTSPHDHWVAPAEAKASGFMDMPEEDELPTVRPDLPKSDALPPATPTPAGLEVGTWFELWNKETWARMQLTWISPQRTMFLFADAHGQTQSMTSRTVERLLESYSLRVLADQSVVDSALDDVVHRAMLNSLHTVGAKP